MGPRSRGLWILLGWLSTGWNLAAAQPRPGDAPYRVVESMGDLQTPQCLAEADDALWIGTLGGGMIRYRDEGDWDVWSSADGLPGNRVNDCVVHAGVLWVATDAGLARFQATRRRFECVRRGRFVSVASGGMLVAGDAAGTVWKVADAGASLRRLGSVDFVPTALAVGANAPWAAAGFEGRVVTGDGARMGKLPPISALVIAEHAGRPPELLVSTAEGPVRLAQTGGRLTAQALGRTGEGDPWIVYAQAQWQNADFIASDRGLLRRPRTEHAPWEHVRLPSMPCGDRLTSVEVFDGALWVGSFDRGICRLQNGTWTHFSGSRFLPSDMVNDLAASEDHLYVATMEGLARIGQDGAFTSYRHTQCAGALSERCPWYRTINGATVDAARGDVWIADQGSIHRVTASRWQHYGVALGIDSTQITRVAAHNGEVAVATGDSGLRLRSGKAFERFDDQHGLADNWVTDLAFDRRGDLWVATCTRGVTQIHDNDVTHWGVQDGLADDYILSVTPLGDEIWIGTLGGLTTLRNGRVHSLTTADGLGGDEVHDVTEYEGRIWVATDGGLTAIERFVINQSDDG